jgi:hypothetical protein
MANLTVTIKINANSSVSEADLHSHLQGIIDDVKSIGEREWHKNCYIDYEESEPVEITFDVSKIKNFYEE